MNKEIWKRIEFDFEHTSTGYYEVSNYGRVRSFNKLYSGKILNGSVTEGYRLFSLKFFEPKDEAFLEMELDMKYEIKELRKKYKEDQNPKTLKLLESRKAKLSKKLATNLKKRTINHHFLVHRMVAELFLEKENEEQTVVAHLDYDKLNNKVSNLKWMTLQENHLHQQESPYVIAEHNIRKKRIRKKGAKLDVTQVMLMKKQLKRGVPIHRLARNFNVTKMQVFRIKKGENWGKINVD